MIMAKAYAKINLALNILGKKENGYHDIDMVILPLELHDRMEIDFLPMDYENEITCDDSSLPNDESNLIVKALNVLIKHYDIKKKFRIHTHKIIPTSAGLGGGSADAAVVINVILKMLKITPSKEELIQIAKEVGSDVPYCLFNKPSRCKGIGEDLSHFTLKKKYNVLIIKPKKGISTKEAYEKYDEINNDEYSNIDELILGLIQGNDELVKKNMINGLEKPALMLLEDISIIKNKLLNDGFDMVLMSGSGSSVFALSTNAKLLQIEAQKFDPSKYFVKITSTLN